ncbi:hypothetical protein ARMSODRAFT_670919 [Armillaria solidipes]|uniref:Uncharacterized protein n=1 Tax=Armillaria solidipes TaxID=1076256 RepID=A0A2H3B580_9AGAR|nr:hypothetical protein ARMSODRAFT_670919 [Armillaria solidipes]
MTRRGSGSFDSSLAHVPQMSVTFWKFGGKWYWYIFLTLRSPLLDKQMGLSRSASSNHVQDAINSPELALVAAVSILALICSHYLSCTSSEMLYGWIGWPVPFRSSKLYPPRRLSIYRRPPRQDLQRHARLASNMEWQGGSLESLRWSAALHSGSAYL